MPYYTEKGSYIYNPTAYAKTGAPMYKTRYKRSPNINMETDIYQLELENDKKYIGKTTDIDRRMEEHFNGSGSKVTKKFRPIEGKIIDTCPGYFSNRLEQKYTNKCINKYGYSKVRGGKYVNSKTLKKTETDSDESSWYDNDSDVSSCYDNDSDDSSCYNIDSDDSSGYDNDSDNNWY